jgi:ABC-type multidrug transport system ATPase subunit/pSer/pThr/pTyr-binding forkhead associated (FHA) protein
MIQCAHCNAFNQPSAKFCARCGKPLRHTQVFSATPKLVVRLPGQVAVQEYSLAAPVITLGRAADNDIVISNPYVSSHHARLDRHGTGYAITDLNSRNGVYVNGTRTTHHLLRHNDVLRIGDALGNSVVLTYVDVSAPPAQVMPLALTQPHILIGRDPQATVPLNAPTVSWHHARIDWDGAGHTLTDLGSTNGTFVNGVRIRQHRLQANDVIQIGPFQLGYRPSGLTSYSVVGNVRLDALELHRTVPFKGGVKVLLNRVSLSIYPREFIALVGGSGAGKTTLMNALSGFQRAPQGRVLINGADYYQQFEAYRALLGYVPQDDIIHRGLPVKSALRYAAELRLPPDSSGAEIERAVQEALAQVEMTGQADQLVSSLSGGQRKRVSIAVELLAQPALFFLDEPTSGLDPGLEKKMMALLNRLADGGRTVILVTHATANIDQADLVAFMAQGRLVFFGPPATARQFFQANDFADIYSLLQDPTNPQAAEQWEQTFQQSPIYNQYVRQRVQQIPSNAAASHGAPASRPRASPWRQGWILARRHLELIMRDKLTLFILLAVMPLIGLLALLIAEPNAFVPVLSARDEAMRTLGNFTPFTDAQKLLFVLALAAVLLGLFAGAYEIVREQAIYRRERMVNLGIVPYVFSKIIVLSLFSLIQAAALLAIIAVRVQLPREGAFLPAPLELYVTLVLATITSITLGLFLSALADSEGMVIYIILVVLFVQILFAGAIFDLPTLTQPLAWLTTTHWTLNALGSTVDLRYINDLTILAGQKAPAKDLTINYGHTAKHLLFVWSILGGFGALFTLLTCLRLKLKDLR